MAVVFFARISYNKNNDKSLENERAEDMRDTNEKAVQAMRAFLEAVGLNLKEQGMEQTPKRVAALYEELFDGVGRNPEEIWRERFASDTKGIVAVTHIPFHSICEHHLLPFFGEVHLAYLPHDGQVAGFGKFVKLVECLAHRPQLQERLTMQIASAIEKGLDAEGVLVVIEAQQLCMTMRDPRAHGTQTITSECRGVFRDEASLCQQAWFLLGGKRE